MITALETPGVAAKVRPDRSWETEITLPSSETGAAVEDAPDSIERAVGQALAIWRSAIATLISSRPVADAFFISTGRSEGVSGRIARANSTIRLPIRRFASRYNVELIVGETAPLSTTFSVPLQWSTAQGDFLSALTPHTWFHAHRGSLGAANFERRSISLISGGHVEAPKVAFGPDLPSYYDEVMSWLELTTVEMKQATGIGRSTRFYWRDNAWRPTTGRQLEQVHSLVRAVVDARGSAEAARDWFFSGSPSGFDLLRNGDVSALSQRAHDLLFGGAEARALVRSAIRANERRFERTDDVGEAVEPGRARNRRRQRRQRKALSDDR